MCFFIQSCEPLGGGKKERKKNAHHSSVSLLSYLPPLPPPSLHSSTDSNLPVADLRVLATQITPRLFPALTCWDRGEVLPLKLPWEPALTCAAGASPATPHPVSHLPRVSQGWADGTFFFSSCKK